MSVSIPVALLGFSAFERNALASYFRLAARRNPTYVHVLDVDEARFVVADADQSGVPELLQAAEIQLSRAKRAGRNQVA